MGDLLISSHPAPAKSSPLPPLVLLSPSEKMTFLIGVIMNSSHFKSTKAVPTSLPANEALGRSLTLG